MLKAELHRRTSKKRRPGRRSESPDPGSHWAQSPLCRWGDRDPEQRGALSRPALQLVTALPWSVPCPPPPGPRPVQSHLHSRTPPSAMAQSPPKPLKGIFICVQGEVRLFPRVLIRKLPGSHFCLSFFLLLGHVYRAGTSERKRQVMVVMAGAGMGTRRAVFHT